MELLKPILIYYKKIGFTLAIDLTFLITNIAKKNAIGVSVSSAKTEIVNNKLSTAVIFIDPAQVLLPIANFTNSIDNLSKIRNYVNTSGNGISYSWNFGDGSSAESTFSPSCKYQGSGTYSVLLTATGIIGTPTIKTINIVIL